MIRFVYMLTAGIFFSNFLYAQEGLKKSVQVNAQVKAATPQVTLFWKKHADATGYQVYKKSKAATAWAAIGSVAATDSFYTDNAVISDSAYEYKVVKQGGTVTAYGYIYAGIQAPAIHDRGAILLLVDNTLSTPCAIEITTLMQDLRGDGWEVLRNDVSRTATDVSVRSMVINQHNTHTNLNAVLLVGHVPVPYSGDMNPDGHPDHKGAWPADVFYADINGTWTDNVVNNTAASRAVNNNVPGDGKWDHSYLPVDAALQVSRIDFANMPAFGKTEEELMKSYLDRAHQYKMNALTVTKRALIDDNFKTMGEGFSQSGWRNFAPTAGINNIEDKDFLATLNTQSYQWAYGCGAGSYTSATGIGNTANIAAQGINAIFTMLFGSYFGDWDSQNNFLRAPLCASTPALTSYWAGRPNLYLHHMALGENIGYDVRLSQNNNTMYDPKSGFGMERLVHQALMGDLSLRTEYVTPPANVQLTSGKEQGAKLSWTSSTEPGVAGYYIYRSATEYGPYSLRSKLITGTSYTDNFGDDGNYFYMVRAVKLQETPSGSYYNLSIGHVDDAFVSYPLDAAHITAASADVTLYPNPAKDVLYVDLPPDNTASIVIDVNDMNGRPVLRHAETNKNGKQRIPLDVASLPGGSYILHIHIGDAHVVRKWIKAK